MLDVFQALRVGSEQRARAVYLLLVTGAIVTGLAMLRPSAAELPNGPQADLLSKHVWHIAAKPRPMGTAEHDRVRDYIAASLRNSGITPEIQTATVTWDAGELVRAADVQNILAHLPGRNSAAAPLLVLTHYDSSPQSPGAADSAASIAAMLELARLHSPSPAHGSVILLFADGHEWGSLGVRAFLERHPSARRIGSVLNLEAHGSSGRPFVIQTSGSPSFADDCSSPADSAPYSEAIWRRSLHTSDFNVLREAGIPGYNLAFFGDPSSFHTARDTPARLNGASLLQQANAVYAVAGCVAAPEQRTTPPETTLTAGGVLREGPGQWALVLSVGLLLAAGAFCVRRHALGTGAALFLALILVVAAAWAANSLTLLGMDPKLVRWQSFDSLFAAALVFTAISANVSVRFLAGRVRRSALIPGIVFVLAVVNVIVAVWAPEARHVSGAAVAGGLAALIVTNRKRAIAPGVAAMVYGLAFAPAMFMSAQLVALLATVLGTVAQIPIIVIVATASLMAAVFSASWTATAVRLRPALVAGGVAVAFLMFARATAAFDDHRPMPDTVVLAADLSARRAFWSTFDGKLDAWSRRRIAQPQSRNIGEFFGGANVKVLASPAPLPNRPGPRAQVIEQSGDTITLLLKPGQDASAVRCDIFTEAPIRSMTIQGRRLPPPSRRQKEATQASFTLVYLHPPPEGFVVELTLAVPAPVELSLVDVIYGFGETATEQAEWARPPDIIADPARLTDCTLVRRAFYLDETGKILPHEERS